MPSVRLFEDRTGKRLSVLEARTRWRKNARNAAAGGRGAARLGAPLPHAPATPSALGLQSTAARPGLQVPRAHLPFSYWDSTGSLLGF